MIRSMYSGISGMMSHQTRLDSIGNNIANVNTTAFKTSRACFQDALYLALDPSGEGSGSFQVGVGVNVGGVSQNISQGPLRETGRPLDLAIYGPGFFGVLDETDSDADSLKFTRDGTFSVDEEGYLVNAAGLKVVDPDEEPIELELDEGQSLEDINITPAGEIYVGDESKGTIGLFKFANIYGLSRAGGNLFVETDASGERISNEDDPEEFGTIYSRFLESSNIDLVQELTDLIATQRGYQANAKVFTTADEVLREIMELKR